MVTRIKARERKQGLKDVVNNFLRWTTDEKRNFFGGGGHRECFATQRELRKKKQIFLWGPRCAGNQKKDWLKIFESEMVICIVV